MLQKTRPIRITADAGTNIIPAENSPVTIIKIEDYLKRRFRYKRTTVNSWAKSSNNPLFKIPDYRRRVTTLSQFVCGSSTIKTCYESSENKLYNRKLPDSRGYRY